MSHFIILFYFPSPPHESKLSGREIICSCSHIHSALHTFVLCPLNLPRGVYPIFLQLMLAHRCYSLFIDRVIILPSTLHIKYFRNPGTRLFIYSSFTCSTLIKLVTLLQLFLSLFVRTVTTFKAKSSIVVALAFIKCTAAKSSHNTVHSCSVRKIVSPRPFTTACALSPSTWRPVDRVQRSSRGNSPLSDAASGTQPYFFHLCGLRAARQVD